jgi:DNA polymerase
VSALRERYLAEIGIDVWRLRHVARGVAKPDVTAAASLDVSQPPATCGNEPAPALRGDEPTPALRGDEPPPATADTWDGLAAQVRACTLCGLHRTRTQTVFGVGRRDAELFVIGEAPGADEDRQGEPFVGRAGQLLNAMLRSIGLPRSEVYIANILKCRPPGNRDPQPEEAGCCTPYLARQLALVRPRAILAVGRIAAQWLLQSDAPIGRLRGRLFHYGEARTPLIVTYHPAFLLRSPLQKATAWTDLCMVKELLQQGR